MRTPLGVLWVVGLFGALSACTAEVAGPGTSANGAGSTGVAGSSGSGDGAGMGGGGSSGLGAPLVATLDGQPLRSRFVRLTHEQWENTVRDLLKLSAAPGLSSSFEGAPPGGNFSNNERRLMITQGLWTDYESAAETLSQQVTHDAAALAKLTGGTTSSATFIQTFGRHAYRRDLTAAEVTRYQTLFDSGAAIFASGNAFTDGVQLVVETMLKSPYFLYRAETGPSNAALSSYEAATKLSYLLTNTMPSDELLDAAKSGQLSTAEQVAGQAQKLLESASAKAAFQRFHTELFGTDRYTNIEKDTTLYPSFGPALAEDLQKADSLLFDYLFAQNLGFKDLVQTPVAFVNASTAPLYGLTATGSGFQQVQLGADRPGFFTRAGFLALNGTLRNSDPIRRGVDIIRRVMGKADFAPPAGVMIPPLPDPKPGQTNRERVTAHTGAGTCGATCHGNYINPLGFSLENFDALGQVRSMDNGKPVNTADQFPFSDGVKSFADSPALMAFVAGDSQAQLTYAAHIAEFVLARDIAEADRPFVTSLSETNMRAASIKQLALTVIQSDEFTKRGAQ